MSINFKNYKFFKKRRGATKNIVVLSTLAVIFISSIGIFFIFNQPQVPNQSLNYISVTPTNTVPKITPNILTCTICSKAVDFSFTVTSTLIKQTTVSVDAVYVLKDSKATDSYSSNKIHVYFNKTIQKKPIYIFLNKPASFEVTFNTSVKDWSFGTYSIQMDLKFGSPFNSNYTYSLAPETFTLVNGFPSNIKYFVPIFITNSQVNATVTPFQQMVTINSANYYSYESPDLSNIEFFDINGSIIYSWLEDGNSRTSTSTYWILLPNGIPAKSTTTVFMGFASTSANLFNGNKTGEAPHLSETMGQYDNIAKIMDPGLLYQIYYCKNSTTFDSAKYQSATYTAYMTNGSRLNYDGGDFNTTINPMNSSSSETLVSAGTYRLFGYQYGYFYPISTWPSYAVPDVSHSWTIKAIGWIDMNQSTNFGVVTDDGLAISTAPNGPAFNGSSWLGGTVPPDNQINAWYPQGAKEYYSTLSTGSLRVEIDNYEFYGSSVFYVVTNLSATFYHASLPPENIIPTNVLGTFSTV